MSNQFINNVGNTKPYIYKKKNQDYGDAFAGLALLASGDKRYADVLKKHAEKFWEWNATNTLLTRIDSECGENSNSLFQRTDRDTSLPFSTPGIWGGFNTNSPVTSMTTPLNEDSHIRNRGRRERGSQTSSSSSSSSSHISTFRPQPPNTSTDVVNGDREPGDYEKDEANVDPSNGNISVNGTPIHCPSSSNMETEDYADLPLAQNFELWDEIEKSLESTMDDAEEVFLKLMELQEGKLASKQKEK